MGLKKNTQPNKKKIFFFLQSHKIRNRPELYQKPHPQRRAAGNLKTRKKNERGETENCILPL